VCIQPLSLVIPPFLVDHSQFIMSPIVGESGEGLGSYLYSVQRFLNPIYEPVV